MTTNDAAERLRTYLVSPVETHPSELQTLLDAALAAEWDAGVKVGAARERRATAERIRERFMAHWSDKALRRDYAFHPSLLFRILDEEAAR